MTTQAHDYCEHGPHCLACPLAASLARNIGEGIGRGLTVMADALHLQPVAVPDDCPASKMDDGAHEDSFTPDGEPRTCGWCCQEWTPGSDGRPAP